jgi:hypothetical protein
MNLLTKAFGRRDWRSFNKQRYRRILEAVGWEPGSSRDDQKKYVVDTLPNGQEVFFLKPGKEAFRPRNPNPHDMAPNVGEVYRDATFEDTWVLLSKISVIDFELFRKVLLLTYRNAFHVDHRVIDGKVRYRPGEDVMNAIRDIDGRIRGILYEGGLLGLMHFFDILGWNEDVKYHTPQGEPSVPAGRRQRTGRVNTLLTFIRVTHEMSDFAVRVREALDPSEVDFQQAYELMQQFARSRGICAATNQQLNSWLSPYLVD